NQLIKSLNDYGWQTDGISKSATEDLHRIFFQISKNAAGNWLIIGNFSVQYHTLLYYEADNRVIEIQNELSRLEKDAVNLFVSFSTAADGALASDLENEGLAGLDFEKLLTKMFEDDSLTERLNKKADQVAKQYPELDRLKSERDRLFAELHEYVMEIYHTKPVLLDANRLMAGEEGFTTYFDIEGIQVKSEKKGNRVKRNTSKSLKTIDATKLKDQEALQISSCLDEVDQ